MKQGFAEHSANASQLSCTGFAQCDAVSSKRIAAPRDTVAASPTTSASERTSTVATSSPASRLGIASRVVAQRA
ncbi:hypothetical protein EM868_11435 [Cupriavidus gilardii]|uniref:hypothetical protein n=1 Tax=Cupriavidus gilardii TaxID=82541 RepID=UPI001EE503F9|nr:hypothetical protein [Cupriavidus gilardii]MCG5260675.1 hypothetical protein [Cupriavidus gilardii]MDF9430404.1 hypothetical protein [Cupriavidus gilardii]